MSTTFLLFLEPLRLPGRERARTTLNRQLAGISWPKSGKVWQAVVVFSPGGKERVAWARTAPHPSIVTGETAQNLQSDSPP